MSGFLDTGVTVRYLLREPQDMAAKAAVLIDSDETLYLTHAIIAETAHVMRSFYRVPREEVVDVLVAFVGKSNIVVWRDEAEQLSEVLLLCRDSGRVSINDALLWATARASRNPVVYTFDRGFPAQGISVRQPGA